MMVEHGISGQQSSSSGGNCQLPLKETSGYHPYPPPQATYNNVVGSRDMFMDTLKKLHGAMGTKFISRNPVIGGKNLDLYRLFVEVTSRGGIAKVLKERKWKEVTSVFNFPSSATNASFILRKYYVSLLYHYEQIYFFKAKCWTPLSADTLQHVSTIKSHPHGLDEHVLSPSQQTYMELPQQKANTASTPEVAVSSAPSTGSPVCGVIDGKFESGYLVTVKFGSEDFKGVLYQVPRNGPQTLPNQLNGIPIQRGPMPEMNRFSVSKPEIRHRRKRRKKSEIRKRDPAHPKPNRSGYNFFFADQHALLKPHYHGRDREISRMIGELWNKLREPERAVYQEIALKDKERYKLELEDYRERLRNGQIMNSAVHPPVPDINLQYEGSASACSEENEMSYDKSDRSNWEEYETVDMELRNVNVEVLGDEEAFELRTKLDRFRDENFSHGHCTVNEKEMSSTNEGQNHQLLGEGAIEDSVSDSAVSRN